MDFQQNYNLKELNTFGLSCLAKKFISVSSEEELVLFLKKINKSDDQLLVLGGGSNILFTKNFDGIVLKNNIKGIDVIEEDKDNVWLKVGSGEVWHDFVLYCVDNNWGGVENLSLIPGTVGAAPIQNIGAYGIEVKDVIEEVEAISLNTLEKQRFNKKECNFGYRDSVFKRELKGEVVICSVTIKLQKNTKVNVSYGAIQQVLDDKGIVKPSIKDVSDIVINIRNSKLPDPKKIGNAGSFFKNPIISKILYNQVKGKYSSVPGYAIDEALIKVPAGWLIEEAGWKGKVVGDIGVHKDQALVLVNYGSGEGADIMKLAFEIQADIFSKFGIEIMPEVNML
jgi:UDP-N-acetylmuramate dehydrogenase